MSKYPQIKSYGLLADAPEKAWSEDNHSGFTSPSRVSYGGVYVTRNLLTAISAGRKPASKNEDILIVICELESRTLMADEDDFSGFLSDVSTSAYMVANLYADYILNGETDFVKQEKDKYIEDSKEKIYYRFKYRVNKSWSPHKNLENRLEELLDILFYYSLKRKAAYIEDYHMWRRAYDSMSHDKDFMKKEKDNLNNILFSEDNESFKNYETSIKEAYMDLLPNPSEAEVEYSKIIDQITRTLSNIVHKNNYKATNIGGLYSGRSLEDITYSGKNKIIGLVRIVEKKSHYDNAVVLWGDVPSDFFEQWKYRIGDTEKMGKPYRFVGSSSWYRKAQQSNPISFNFGKTKSYKVTDPFRDNQSYIVYHGFRDTADAWNTIRHGLSGQERVGRVYSYESQNNPYGLFVTLNQKTAQEFSSSYGDSVIIEFAAKGSEMESPVWPGGSYTVQGQMAQYWKGDTYEEQMADRENSRIKKREDIQTSLTKEIEENEAYIKKLEEDLAEWEAMENIPKENQGHVDHLRIRIDSLREDTEHKRGILISDRPELANSLLSSEYQALFTGDLDPSEIRAIWVRKVDPELGYARVNDPFARMSVEEFVEKFEEQQNEKTRDVHNKLFSPREDFDVDKFLSRAPDYITRDLKRSAEIFSYNMYSINQYFWPRQREDAIRYFESLLK